MNFLEERIVKDGIVKEGNVLKVDSFLNHQMDTALFNQMGEEFEKRFANKKINKILTIEAWAFRWADRLSAILDTSWNHLRLLMEWMPRQGILPSGSSR